MSRQWITHKPLDAHCRWVFTFQGFIRAWWWKVTKETQAHSILQMVSSLLPSNQDQSQKCPWEVHGGCGTYAYNACEDTTLTNSTGEDWYAFALFGLRPSQCESGHLHNLHNSAWNFFALKVTTRYKVQSLFFIHFPVWSVLNIERIEPQISSMGSYGMMTIVWVVCPSARHRDTWGQARAQDLSWRIVLGNGSQSGWSGSKGEQSCLLSCSASWGGKASRKNPGWELAEI